MLSWCQSARSLRRRDSLTAGHLPGIPLYHGDGGPERLGAATGRCPVMAIAPLSTSSIARLSPTSSTTNLWRLLGNLSHNGISAVLNNHTCVPDPVTLVCETWTSYIYDDSN